MPRAAGTALGDTRPPSSACLGGVRRVEKKRGSGKSRMMTQERNAIKSDTVSGWNCKHCHSRKPMLPPCRKARISHRAWDVLSMMPLVLSPARTARAATLLSHHLLMFSRVSTLSRSIIGKVSSPVEASPTPQTFQREVTLVAVKGVAWKVMMTMAKEMPPSLSVRTAHARTGECKVLPTAWLRAPLQGNWTIATGTLHVKASHMRPTRPVEGSNIHVAVVPSTAPICSSALSVRVRMGCRWLLSWICERAMGGKRTTRMVVWYAERICKSVCLLERQGIKGATGTISPPTNQDIPSIALLVLGAAEFYNSQTLIIQCNCISDQAHK